MPNLTGYALCSSKSHSMTAAASSGRPPQQLLCPFHALLLLQPLLWRALEMPLRRVELPMSPQ
jgi:hypothetical protein